jgi:hypothetical protein
VHGVLARDARRAAGTGLLTRPPPRPPPRAVMPGVVVRQRKPWRRKDGIFIYFEGEHFPRVRAGVHAPTQANFAPPGLG